MRHNACRYGAYRQLEIIISLNKSPLVWFVVQTSEVIGLADLYKLNGGMYTNALSPCDLLISL